MNATRFNAPRTTTPPFTRLAVRSALVLAFAALYVPSAAAAPLLGTAQSFAVLGSATVTNTGSTAIYGNVGVDPGSAITGFPPGVVTGGSLHGADGVSSQAQSDARIAYNTLKALPFTHDLTGQDLGSQPALVPGVYHFDTSAQLTGKLILDFGGSNEPFVFQIGTTLTTASASMVDVLNGSPLSGVYWVLGVTGGAGTGSVTLGTSTMFAGNILALDSTTLTTSATILCGRAIALNAAVTMDTSTISKDCTAEEFNSERTDFGSLGFSGGFESFPDANAPGGIAFRPIQDLPQASAPEPSPLALLGFGLAGLIGVARRRKAPPARQVTLVG